MWFDIGDSAFRIEAPDDSLKWALEAVPLPLRLAETNLPNSGAFRAATCSPDELERRAAAGTACGGRRLTLPAVPEMDVAVDLLIRPTDALFLCAGHGMATVSADGREAELLSARPEALPTAALAAAVVLAMVAERGFSPVHASLVDRGGVGVMFCGERSRGKSSSCMALTRAGWTMRADDRCFVRVSDGRATIWGPGGRLSLRPGAATLWPDLAERLAQDGAVPKHLLDVADAGGKAQAGSVRCGALMFPEVVGKGPHRVKDMPRAEALGEMLFTTGLAVLPAHAALHFKHLTTLIEQTPCYRLELGENMDHLSPVVAEVLA